MTLLTKLLLSSRLLQFRNGQVEPRSAQTVAQATPPSLFGGSYSKPFITVMKELIAVLFSHV